SRAERHREAEDPRRQSAAAGDSPSGQGHAAPARARVRGRMLSPAARGAAQAQRQAARGARGVRGGLQGASRSARQRVHRKNEEAAGLTMSSRYWELTVAVPPDASEGLTNFVWELGAVGVVEEETPADGARLRAFFPDAADSEAVARSAAARRARSISARAPAFSPSPPRGSACPKSSPSTPIPTPSPPPPRTFSAMGSTAA